MIDRDGIRQRYEALQSFLDERGRRLWASAEAKAAGYGGIAAVAQVTGLAPSTIGRGLKDLADQSPLPPGRLRRPGAGRKPSVETDPQLRPALEALVEPTARGDPEAPLRWTCKSLRRLADELQAQGHRVSRTLVGTLLHDLGFSLQANAKTREGGRHPDRDAQFAFINAHLTRALAAGEPVISVDTKKKELVGDFKNAGRAWRPKGSPEAVRVHDFLIRELGRAVPYGVYDLATNAGWVGVGQDHDTAAFAVQTIRRWWQEIGQSRYRATPRLTITADGGGSNGVRVRLWKRELQKLCDETGLAITVHHLPPGNEQVERDRAPAVLVHQPELASNASGELSGDRRPDRGDHDQDRPERAVRARPASLSEGGGCVRCRNCRAQHRARRVPWRVELYHLAPPSLTLTGSRSCTYFLTGPKPRRSRR
jgi:hypothetical protein